MAFLLKYRPFLGLAVLLALASTARAQPKIGFSSPKFEAMYKKAQSLLDTSPDSCILICTQALSMIKDQSGDEAASFHSYRGFAYEHLGAYRKALKDQYFVLAFAKRDKDPKRLGNCYNNVGVIYDYMGNLDSALIFYQKGYDVFKKASDQDGISSSAGNLGLLYLNKGNFKRSLDYLFEAKKIATAIKDSASLSASLTNIGLAYDKQGRFDKALEYFRESSRIDSLLNDSLNLALSYNNIGSIFFARKDFDRSREFHQRALDIRTRANYRPGMSESYHNLALVYEAKKQPEKAKIYYEKASEIAESIHDTYNQTMILMNFGNYYNQQHQYNEAIRCLKQAIAYSQSQGGYLDEYKVYRYLALAYAGQGNYKDAFDYYRKYSTISDSLKSFDNSKKLAELELESEYEKKKQEDAFKIKQRELKIEAEKKHTRIIQWALIGGISLLLLVLVIIFRGYRIKQKANEQLQRQNDVITHQHREIEEQKNIIEEKNRNITDSIQYAQRLQNAILPPPALLNTHLRDYFILYRPKDIVSGDFYWAHECEKGFLFAVVDCTGHGVPGSMVSIIANNALNRTVNEFKIFQPAAILNKVAELVEEYFNRNQEEGEIRDGMDISLCLLEKNTGKLQFAGANNSLIVIRSQGQLEELKADKQPIGHYENRKPYQNHEIQLQRGDMLYLYTDGYADQFGGENGKKFKSSRLKEMLADLGSLELHTQKARLEQTLDNWTGGFEQNDDICVMGVKV